MKLDRIDVLVVDDDDAIRTMLCRALQHRGLVCREARDGIEALRYLESGDCAVILLDLMMPRMDGHAFIDRFTGSPEYWQRPIVFALSAADLGDLRRARADAVHALVRKPFDVNQLAELVVLCVAARWRDSFAKETAAREP